MARAPTGVVALGIGVVVAVAGWLGWQALAPEPEVAPQPEPVAAAAPEAAAPISAAPEPPAQPATLPPEPPRFDVVRVDGTGLATIAGSAAPGAKISLRVDGAEVATASADGSGQFATLLTLSASTAPRLLSLVMITPEGAELAGVETVVLAPIAPPAAPATATVEPPATAEDSAATAPAEPAAPEATPVPAAETAETTPAAPAALLVSPEGVEVLTPAAREIALSIDSIAYAPDGAVLVGGHAAAGSTLRLYLDDAAIGEALVEASGTWQARLPEVAAGLHRLRADQVDAAGKVSARFETPFKREAPEALAALVAASPVAANPIAPAPVEAAPAITNASPAPAAAAAPEPTPVVPAAPVSITVQPGFTLWGIAETAFGDGVLYVQVFEANKDKIKDPDLIYPGQIFTVPQAP